MDVGSVAARSKVAVQPIFSPAATLEESQLKEDNTAVGGFTKIVILTVSPAAEAFIFAEVLTVTLVASTVKVALDDPATTTTDGGITTGPVPENTATRRLVAGSIRFRVHDVAWPANNVV
jgi:hypothetical protein